MPSNSKELTSPLCVTLQSPYRLFKLHMKAHVQSTRHIVLLLVDSFMTRHRSGVSHFAVDVISY
jgi:hypothetical protein